ncbi:MAG: exosortase/archaeosortase family protein [Chthoniobacteraceae bacterium]|jgi:exosortase
MSNDVSTGGGEKAAPIDYLGFLKRRWTPLGIAKALLLVAIGYTLYYFFGVIHLYQGLPISLWAWARYAPRYNFEHGKLVLPIFAFLVWIHREEIIRAKKQGCNQGLIWVALGCLIFAAGARTLQGRVGMAAGPILLYGMVLYLWGKEVARILLFPIVFLVFLIPVSAIEQATFHLQFLVTGIAKAVCGLMGIHLYSVGTTLRPVDQSFGGFEVAEGCSGIRSLMAMVMVTAIYVHMTQNKLWKKVVILLFSIGFAIIGNAGRITSIFVVAKYVSPQFAGGTYHEYSGYVSFPIALGAMLLMSWVLDLPIFEAAKVIKTGKAEPGSGLETLTKKDQATYDY